ncbi:MAG: hypothetical protein HOV80_12335 [Polyangiaceae bacterium]|nr:hypothetical protein [Polyangiaceae bacterium]
MRLRFALPLAAAIGLWSASAFAQPTAEDRAIAQTLFDEGRALMNAGKHAEACPKLEESQRLDPAGGTLLHLGACYEGAGKLASAWSTFHSALSQANKDKRADRADAARERIAALEPKLSKLTIVVPPAVADLTGVQITRNGVKVGAGQFGSAIPVDAGVVKIVAKATGKRAYETEITVGKEPSTPRVEIPALEDEPVSAPATPPPVPNQQPTSDTETAPNDGGPQRAAGIALGSIGLAAGIVGGVFGGLALMKQGEAEDHCNEQNLCSQEGLDIQEEGVLFGNIATAGLAAGGALFGTGLIVFLTAPSDEGATTTAAVSPNGFRLIHRW